MKLKIMLIVLLCFSVGMAQQKDKKVKADKGKWEELKEYPKPISPIQPEYPQVAKLAGIQGKVYVEAMISEKGNVVSTKILKSDHESLISAAVDAIVKTKFEPGVSKEGKKVKATVVIPMAFKLDDKEKSTTKESKEPNSEVIDLENTSVEKLPELLESVKPEYPEIAKNAGITGKVFIKALVDKEGNVKKAVTMKSDCEYFNQPAMDAAKKSKFSPAIQEGKPVAVWIVLPYKFALDGVKDKNEREFFLVILVGTNNKNYPKEAIENKIKGQVLIKVFLDDVTGKLEKTEIYKSDNEILNKGAVEELTGRWEKIYESHKKALREERSKGKSIPVDAEIKSGSIICVGFELKDFEK